MRLLFAAGLAFSWIATASAQLAPTAASWTSYGGNPQHTALFSGSSQAINKIHWKASLDDNRSYYGSELLIHYASPVVSPANTLVHGFRRTTTVNGSPDYDNWEIVGRSGATGQPLWTMGTDYSAPEVFPSDWTSVFPMCLVNMSSNAISNPDVKSSLSGTGPVSKPSFGPLGSVGSSVGVAMAGAGGTIWVRRSADAATTTVAQIPFYTTAGDYRAHAAAYSPIKINTPLTADALGNVYFGYIVSGTLPSSLAQLGTGGVAKVNPVSGATKFVSVQSLNIDSGLGQPGMNAAPAVSADGLSIYVGLAPTGGGTGYLAKLSTSTLGKVASVALMDPSVAGGAAQLINQSSAAPMVGPDGHVFLGVFGYAYRESHGWMLQFDGNLKQTDSTGATYPIGAFGWDDTASVVPASIVPSYTGRGTYLILTKYNNYDFGSSDPGADGSNHVALLDPTSNSLSIDRQSGIKIMNEVLLILSPTPAPSSSHPNARNEWCINSAAVDVAKKSAIINCEDGHVYRWSFVTNTITEGLGLQPATGEAYTSTVIGTDGTIYAINNSILFAVGN